MSFLNIIKEEQQKEKLNSVKRGRKPKQVDLNFLKEIESIPEGYYPPGWKINGLTFAETVTAYESFKKKKGELTESEAITAHNYEILKSCYRTNKHILRLINRFIGKLNFDAYYNNLGYTGSSEFATENFKFLSGYSTEDDGFNLSNWKRITADLEQPVGYKNPPFNKLEDAARIVNVFAEDKRKPRLAFMCTFDYTNYFQNCSEMADYFIKLGRIPFVPMPGIKTSTPRGSVGLFIYNPILEIGNSRFIMFEGNRYYVDDLRKERNTLNLSQMSLDDLLKPLSPEELAQIPPLDPKAIDNALERGMKESEMERNARYGLRI